MGTEQYQTISDAFLISLCVFNPASSVPYKLIQVSPSYYAYFAFDQSDFVKIVRDRSLHRQDAYKLVYIREGELYLRVETERHKYSTGSCFLINRNVRHNEEYTSPYSTISLFLSDELFREIVTEHDEKYMKTQHLWDKNTELYRFFQKALTKTESEGKDYIDFIPKVVPDAPHDPVQIMFDKLAESVLDPMPGSSFLFMSLVCRILRYLGDKERYTTVPLNLGSEAEGLLFSRINALLEQSDGRLSRDDLARKLNYSGGYINRVVNKYTGMNISRYASSITMKRAAWMLVHSDKTISEIAIELDFTNRTIFYNAFGRVYGETPRQYRIRLRKERS